MLSEKKQNKVINANDITRQNAVVISCGEQIRISSSTFFQQFEIKVKDVTIKIIQKLNYPKGE